MINYYLPTSVEIDGVKYQINKNGDYRVVLDIIQITNDSSLSQQEKTYNALCVFYGYDKEKKMFNIPENTQMAVQELSRFIGCGEVDEDTKPQPKLMDWEQDWELIVPAVNKVLGYDIRGVEYLHWWTLIAAYMEIDGESVFAKVKDIRLKKSKGMKLDKSEERFFNDNRKIIVLKSNLSKEAEDWLSSED